MLTILLPGNEYWNEQTNEFVTLKAASLTLEHSLVSLAKWESKWNKPFLSKEPKTYQETTDYVRCMTLTQNVDPAVYAYIPSNTIKEVNAYIALPMTATTFREDRNHPHNREIITAEIIYYWMISLNIPFECQKWHLNRLLTLIRVCNAKNAPPKKMSKRDVMAQNAALNASRRKALNSTG